MPQHSPSEQRVLDALDSKSGSVTAVAALLCVSETYVHRIKKSLWKPPQKSSPQTALAVIDSPKKLDPALDRVATLRKKTFDHIEDHLIDMPHKESVALLKVLLTYEVALNRADTPLVDNRQVNTYTVLVDKLSEIAGPDELRLLAGVDAPIIIEGETTNA